MNHTLVDQCFKSFKDYIASRDNSRLKSLNTRFMSKVKTEFTDGSVEISKHKNDHKYSFNELVPFLDFCELGQWSNAREKFEKAFEEYQTFVQVLDTLNRNEKELPKPETTRATTNNSTHAKNVTDSNKSRNPRVSTESPIGGQSAAQPPREKSQAPLNHVPDNYTLSSLKNVAALSNQGRLVENTSRNTDELDSRNYNGTQLYHSGFYKDKNQYSMTSDNNDKSTRQRATPVSPMEKGLSAPDYHSNSQSSKSSIEEPQTAFSVSPRDRHSLVHDRGNKSDHTKRGELPKTEYGPNEVDVYRRSENASILLRDNNPNIADLSDINRPTKLAERFSELYSNEHTDAFEELVKYHQDKPTGEDQEKEIVEDLLRVVKHAYDHCKKWNENIENMLKTEEQTKPPKSEDEIIQIKGQLLERKKKLVKDKAVDIVQGFMEKKIPNLSPRHASEKGKSKFMKYVKATVEIVWWMFAQTPPIYLEYAESGPFVSDCYRSYTKSGRFVAFCVWPLVLLHKDGPILSKGIAQGTDVQPYSK